MNALHPEGSPYLSKALQDVAAERAHQRRKWGADHDMDHTATVLASQACGYLLPGQMPVEGVDWAYKSKVLDKDPRRVQMVKGVALGLAAIERYDAEVADGVKPAADLIDCEGASPCSTCPDKHECGRSGCVRIAQRRKAMNADAGSAAVGGVPGTHETKENDRG